MTITNPHTCPSCGNEKSPADFRGSNGMPKKKCADCRRAVRERRTGDKTCSVCKTEKPAEEFNDRGRIRQTCATCRAKRRNREREERERGYQDHDDGIVRALRAWR